MSRKLLQDHRRETEGFYSTIKEVPSSRCICQVLSHVQLNLTSRTVACQVPLSMEFSKQEYWSGLTFPTPGDLPDPGIKSVSLPLFPAEPLGKPLAYLLHRKKS